ncbi:hypothetical protein OAS35_01350 [Pelagibacteraceae bacterium]|nr:hypothetical protein [Pelagibacteraceae bacterium]
MFLKKTKIFKELPILIGILIYSYLVNWFSGNIGIMPIDSFGFLDTGHSILHGHLPIRDFWIFTGLLVDYMEALFLFIFGNNWNSHLAHSSFMNIIATLGVFFFLKELNLKFNYVVFYSICFSTLCYPLSGTPFAYIHAYIFSLLAIFNLVIAIKNKNNILWFIFPFICLFAFLSMQTPTAYILIILAILLIHYFFKYKNFINLKFFILGSFTSLLLFILFLYFTNTPIINFIYQYILFPLTIGEGRISSNEMAYIGLVDQLNFKRLFGEFKFIHILLFPLIFISIKNIKKNNKETNLINLTIISCVFAFFFNQLITANQIYIFSLIPVIAAILHFNLNRKKINPKLFYLIIFIVLFSTIKYHYRFNIDRKFHDLENVDKGKAINASEVHENFKNLKWISKSEEPNKELRVIKQAIEIIDNDNREKTLITHYHFMSTILDKKLNIINRWYLWDNNTHPTENHKYFKFYKSLINKNIRENDIKVIYLLGQKNEILFDNVKNYFTDVCFESKTIVQKRFSSHKIITCNK